MLMAETSPPSGRSSAASSEGGGGSSGLDAHSLELLEHEQRARQRAPPHAQSSAAVAPPFGEGGGSAGETSEAAAAREFCFFHWNDVTEYLIKLNSIFNWILFWLQKQTAAALRQRPVAVGEHLLGNRVPAAAQRLPLPRHRCLQTVLLPRNQVRCSLGWSNGTWVSFLVLVWRNTLLFEWHLVISAFNYIWLYMTEYLIRKLILLFFLTCMTDYSSIKYIIINEF